MRFNDFIVERDLELRSVFRRLRAANPFLNSRQLWSLAVRQRPSRHWLSRERVMRYVTRRLRGAASGGSGRERRRHLDYIFRLVAEGDKAARHSAAELEARVDSILSRPAPEYFITARSAEKSVRATCRALRLAL